VRAISHDLPNESRRRVTPSSGAGIESSVGHISNMRNTEEALPFELLYAIKSEIASIIW
jgi:hypothetical protein